MSKRGLVILGVIVALGAGAWLVSAQLGDEPRDVSTTSDEAYALFQEGRAHLERYEIEEAVDAFEAAVEADSTFAMAFLQLGQAQFLGGQSVMGRVNLRRAWERREAASERERLWIEMFDARYARKPAAADSLAGELVTLYPEHPWVLRMQGDRAREQADYEAALDFYDRVLELDPGAVDIHNMKGYTYLAMGRYEDAVQSLQRYAFYSPDQPNPHDSLGEAYFATGRFDEATKEFLTALELEPGFAWSALHLVDVLSVTGQVDRAHRVLDEYEDLMIERGWVQPYNQTLMRIDLRAERWEELLAQSDELLRDSEILTKPDEMTVFAMFTRTMALLELGELDAARESLERLASMSDAFFESMSKQYEWFEQVARLNRAVVMARLARAEGRPAEGIEELASAIEASHRSPHELAFFRYHLGLAQLDADRYEEAAATAESALERIPTLPGLNYVAALAKLKLGDREGALEHLGTYLEVMRMADKDLVPAERAKQLLQRIVPRS